MINIICDNNVFFSFMKSMKHFPRNFEKNQNNIVNQIWKFNLFVSHSLVLLPSAGQ